jgi:hypothetical protein
MSGGLTPELRELVEAAPLVHLATIDPDGAPQVSVIWIGLDGDQLVSGHMGRYRKIRERAWDLLDRLTKLYMSPEDEFPAPRGPGLILRYEVERVGGVGPWAPSR